MKLRGKLGAKFHSHFLLCSVTVVIKMEDDQESTQLSKEAKLGLILLSIKLSTFITSLVIAYSIGGFPALLVVFLIHLTHLV